MCFALLCFPFIAEPGRPGPEQRTGWYLLLDSYAITNNSNNMSCKNANVSELKDKSCWLEKIFFSFDSFYFTSVNSPINSTSH